MTLLNEVEITKVTNKYFHVKPVDESAISEYTLRYFESGKGNWSRIDRSTGFFSSYHGSEKAFLVSDLSAYQYSLRAPVFIKEVYSVLESLSAYLKVPEEVERRDWKSWSPSDLTFLKNKLKELEALSGEVESYLEEFNAQ